MNLLDANFLFASLIWGSVGLAYFVYGKRAQSWVPMLGGALMILASYFIGSALIMSLVCLALILVVYVLLRQGY